MNWTNEKPVVPGAYWIRGNGLEMEALLHVRPDPENENALSCNLHLSTSNFDLGYGYTVEQLSEEFEWSGPLLAAPEKLEALLGEALVRLVAIEPNADNLRKWESLVGIV